MARLPRKAVFDPHEVGVYHCINRCVRRTRLCGIDLLTGKSYEHRKRWLQNRLMFLAGVMAIDVEGFTLMSNHLHAILRNRPDIADRWSAEEVARRWLKVCPPYRPGACEPVGQPTELEIAAIVNNPQRVAELRLRLSNPSWLMRFLTEKLARVANREDEVTGRFWEGRFKMQRLLDEWAVAACLVYVDLNPLRAGIARVPDNCEYTSLFERLGGIMESFLEGLDEREKREYGVCSGSPEPVPCGNGTIPTDRAFSPVKASDVAQSRHPAPFAPASGVQDSVLEETAAGPGNSAFGENGYPKLRQWKLSEIAGGMTAHPRSAWLAPLEISESLLQKPVPACRASNLGCLNMTISQYLQLLEWTGRNWRNPESSPEAGPNPAKSTASPTETPEICHQLGLDGEAWLKFVAMFGGKKKRRAAGRPEALQAEAVKRGRRWIHGIAQSREIFGQHQIEQVVQQTSSCG